MAHPVWGASIVCATILFPGACFAWVRTIRGQTLADYLPDRVADIRLGAAVRFRMKHRLLLAGSASSPMPPESGHWKNERTANVGFLELVPRGSPRPEAVIHRDDNDCLFNLPKLTSLALATRLIRFRIRTVQDCANREGLRVNDACRQQDDPLQSIRAVPLDRRLCLRSGQNLVASCKRSS